jgi:Predicted molecular chaperone distantly related to HSP70-fold metalloproteases
MKESYYSLGLMSGTSMDGVDVSIIKTDGKNKIFTDIR